MTRLLTCLTLGLCFSLSVGITRAADEVSRKPPEFYALRLAPLLTPLEKIKELARTAPQEGDAVVLAHEVLHWVTEDNKRILVEHTVHLAHNEAGVQKMTEHSEFYKKLISKPHVALARSILPDGREIEVEGKGALLHSPQPDADMALYGDVGELRVVFPGVKVGAITELITVMEQTELAIPGELMTEMVWTDQWHTLLKRLIVDAPQAMTSRLKVVPIAMAVPPVAKSSPNAGRERLEWQGKDLPEVPPEPGQPPYVRTGPALCLTTLKDWNQVAAWFAKLLSERSAFPEPTLKELGGAEKATTPEARKALLSSLLKKVSDDVRYTGLEFGMGAFQPRDPSQVWATRYGDCKDKSNLLHVLLTGYGIKSWLALVNTEHDGVISRDCPSVRRFTHVILAVDDGRGGLIWCDPTIPHVPAGELSSAAGDRDVLLIKDGQAEWVRTPLAFSGFTEYVADLKPRAEGGWSGQLNITGRGLSGISLGDYFEKSDRQQARNIALWIANGLVPRAEVLDFVKEPVKGDVTFQMKIYLDVPGVPGQVPEVRPPQPSWEDDFTNLRKRSTAMFQPLMKRSAKLRYTLPKGTSLGALPSPLKLKTPAFVAETKWESDATTCTVSVSWETLTSVVPAEVYEECHTAAQTLAAWCDKPLPLNASGATLPTTASVDDLPVMPTGAGQLDLIDRRYPYGGNLRLRRAALARVAELFPRDHKAVFAAEIQLASVDMGENKPEAAAKRLRDVMNRLGEKVSADEMSWAEGTLVFVLQFSGKTKDALELAQRSYARTEAAQENRAQVGLMLAEMLQEKTPAKAIAVLRECVGWQTTALPKVFNRLTQLLVEQGKVAEIGTVVQGLYAKGLPQVQAACSTLAAGAQEMVAAKKSAQASKWLDAVQAACSEELQKGISSSMNLARAQVEASGLGSKIQDRLKVFLNRGGFRTWDNVLPEFASASAWDTANSFQRLVQQGRHVDALRYGVRFLASFPPDESQGYMLAQVTAAAFEVSYSAPDAGPILEELLNLCEMLPNNHTTFLQARCYRATMVAWEDELGAEAILRSVLAVPDLPHDIWLKATSSLGDVLQRLKRTPEAIEVNERLLPYATEFGAFHGLVRAVMLRVEVGDYDKACAIADKLRTPFASLNPYIESAETVEDILALTEKPEEAAAYWESTKGWWPEWQKFEANAGVKLLHAGNTMLLTNTRTVGAMLGQKLQAGDITGVLESLGMASRAARVSPLWLWQVGSVISFLGPRMGAQEVSLRTLAIEMLTKSRMPDRGRKAETDVVRLMLYSGTEKTDDAFAFAREQWPKYEKQDLRTATFARIWLSYAMSKQRDLDLAMAAARTVLEAKDNPADADRVLLVSLLADALTSLRRPEEAVALLKKEIEHPAVKNAQLAPALQKQLQSLGMIAGDSPAFSRAVEEWISAQPRFRWLDFVEPKELSAEDLKVKTQADAVATENPTEMFNPLLSQKAAPAPVQEEPASARLKKAYLIMTSPEASFTKKLEAWSSNIGAFLVSARAPARDLSEWIRQGLNDERLPETARVMLLTEVGRQALMRSSTEVANDVLKQPIAERLVERIKVNLERRIRVEQCDVRNDDAVKAFATSVKVSSDDAVWFGQSSWARLVWRVIADGKLETAEWLLEHPNDFTGLVPQNNGTTDNSAQALRALEIVRFAKVLRTWRDEVVVPTFASSLPKDWKTARRPAEMGFMLNYNMITLLDPQRTWAVWTWSLAHDPFVALNAEMLGNVLDVSRKHIWKGAVPLGATFASRMSSAAGANPLMGAFQEQSGIVGQLAWALADWNDESQTAPLMEQAPKLPAAARNEFAGLLQTASIRLGKASPAVLEASDPGTRLSMMLARGDANAVHQFINSSTPEVLMQDDMLSLTIRAYRLCGMDAEARIAIQKARKIVTDKVAESWVNLDTDAINTVIDLWSAIGEPDAVPEAWTEDMARFIESPYWRGIVLTRSASLRRQWQNALRHAQTLLKAEPENTSFEYDRAEALVQLGRPQEAKGAIEIFMKKEADNPRMPKVREWLEAINKP